MGDLLPSGIKAKKIGGWEGEGCTQFVHARSRMTIDSRIPTMLLCRDGARRVFTNQADIACIKLEAL